AAWAWLQLGRERYHAFQWLRRALLVQLLVTLVGLYRLDPWPATAVMAVALLGLGVVLAEKARLEQTGRGAAHKGRGSATTSAPPAPSRTQPGSRPNRGGGPPLMSCQARVTSGQDAASTAPPTRGAHPAAMARTRNSRAMIDTPGITAAPRRKAASIRSAWVRSGRSAES